MGWKADLPRMAAFGGKRPFCHPPTSSLVGGCRAYQKRAGVPDIILQLHPVLTRERKASVLSQFDQAPTQRANVHEHCPGMAIVDGRHATLGVCAASVG